MEPWNDVKFMRFRARPSGRLLGFKIISNPMNKLPDTQLFMSGPVFEDAPVRIFDFGGGA